MPDRTGIGEPRDDELLPRCSRPHTPARVVAGEGGAASAAEELDGADGADGADVASSDGADGADVARSCADVLFRSVSHISQVRNSAGFTKVQNGQLHADSMVIEPPACPAWVMTSH